MKDLVKIVTMGTRTEHPPGDIAHYPNGQPHFIILYFHTPFLIQTDSGTERGEAGNAVIHTPDYPQWHCGVDSKPFCNDWCILSGRNVFEILQKQNIPCNVILPLSRSIQISERFSQLKQIRLERGPLWEERVSADIERIFLEIAHLLLLQKPETQILTHQRHESSLRSIRAKVHQQLQKNWTLAQMAKEAGLSVNRFAVLYKTIFGISPIEDLIRERLLLATIRLKNPKRSIKEIAHECGFENVYYFSRLFKQRHGKSPRNWRATV